MSEQAQLLDTEVRELNPYWVDPEQKLLIPINPQHYAAHRYQIILARLDIQAEKNPAQFNSGNYIAIMEKLEKLWSQINSGASSAIHDEDPLGKNGDPTTTPQLGETTPVGMGVGVSADNPLAG